MEPWQEEARFTHRQERRLFRRPICADCCLPITGERFLPLDGAVLCEQCVELRFVQLSYEEW